MLVVQVRMHQCQIQFSNEYQWNLAVPYKSNEYTCGTGTYVCIKARHDAAMINNTSWLYHTIPMNILVVLVRTVCINARYNAAMINTADYVI